MIVCRECEVVLYYDTMPAGLAEVEKVVCSSCAYDYTMYFENDAYDLANDR